MTRPRFTGIVLGARTRRRLRAVRRHVMSTVCVWHAVLARTGSRCACGAWVGGGRVSRLSL